MAFKTQDELDKLGNPKFSAQCEDLGLDPERIRMHQNRIRSIVLAGQSQFFKIVDTCRPSNDGLIQPSQITLEQNLEGIISFIPAAGASSRYTQRLAKLMNALDQSEAMDLDAALDELRCSEVSNMMIQPYLAKILKQGIKAQDVDRDRLHNELSAPKAFYPCVKEGLTFMDLKCLEDDSLALFEGTVFVSSTASHNDFVKKLQEKNYPRKTLVIEQGPSQSTIRFDETITPIEESHGGFSLVPAGHGTLAHCLPKLKANFPTAHAVLIRNIDNVIGTSTEVQNEVKKFISFYNFIWKNIAKIRKHLHRERWDAADDIASGLIQALGLTTTRNKNQTPLWFLQECLFHCGDALVEILGGSKDKQTLLKLYNRPLNILGQVPNTQKDVGGTPVFAKLKNATFKICLEVPHASPEDKKTFLESPEYATHFNPVFALAEIDFNPSYYEDAPYSSWILAKKSYRGQTVYYHESVLYELLGNNLLANVIFAEIPRSLFNPHKNLEDCKGRSLKDWITSH